MTNLSRLKIGDDLKFKSITVWNSRVNTRKIRGFLCNTLPGEVDPNHQVQRIAVLVRFGGWTDFQVRPNEIVE